jgi:site-specific recombinase XerD
MLTITRRWPIAAAIPEPQLDRRGYYRSPITLPSYRLGQPSAIKGRRFPPEPLTPDEVWALVDACGRGPAGRRNRALIVTMWRAGLRVSEAIALAPKDVDLDRGHVRVLHGKGDKSRIVALDPGACAIIERWVTERRTLELGTPAPLFCVISQPTAGEPIAASYVRELLHKLAIKAGINKRVHPHGLRHSYASFLMDQGVPIHHIKRMLGHSSLAVTERYVDHINPAAVLEEVRALDWPGHISQES